MAEEQETVKETSEAGNKTNDSGKSNNQVATAQPQVDKVKTEELPSPEKKDKDQNIVFIGQKPFMNYVTAVVTQFQTKKNKEVIIKARGKFISRAVDVAEVSAKRFLKEENLKVKDIKIDSEEFENKEGKRVNVSTIDIVLERQS